jgi:macrolide resistance protein
VIATILGAALGGGLIDRWGPRAVVVIAGVVGALATALVPVLAAADALSYPALVGLVALGAAFDTPGAAAQDSRLPELGRLAGLSIERVSALKAVFGYGAVLGGPVLGGTAIGYLGPEPTLWLTAGCSAASALLALQALPARRRVVQRAPSASGFEWAGLDHLRHEPLLLPLLGIVMLFAGTTSALASVIMPALFQGAGRAAAELGTFSSALGAGALAGIAAYGAIGKRIAPRLLLAVAFAIYAGTVLLLSLLPPLPVLVALGAVAGFVSGPTSPIFNTALYARTPAHLRGRVLGATAAVVMSGAPVMAIASGMLVDRAGPRFALFVAALLALVVAALALRLRFDAPRPAAGIDRAAVPERSS